MKNKTMLKKIQELFKPKRTNRQNEEIDAIHKSYKLINDSKNFYSIDDILIDLKITIDSALTKWVVNRIINALKSNYKNGNEVIYKDLIFSFQLGEDIKYPILSNEQRPNLNSVDLEKVVDGKEEQYIYSELYKQIKNKLKMNCAVKLYEGLILKPSAQGKTKILFLFK